MRQIKARLKKGVVTSEREQRIALRSQLGVSLDGERFKRYVEDPKAGKLPRYDEKDGYHICTSVFVGMLEHKWIEYEWLAGEPTKITPKAGLKIVPKPKPKPKKRGKE